MNKIDTLENFNTARLSKNPYPVEDRPRGQKDLDSVLFHRRMIRKNGHSDPIWIIHKKGKYILLDGAHRIVASYLENKRKILCYLINMDS
jgi:ParB-like chromosome segregation protein Spo0J